MSEGDDNKMEVVEDTTTSSFQVIQSENSIREETPLKINEEPGTSS